MTTRTLQGNLQVKPLIGNSCPLWLKEQSKIWDRRDRCLFGAGLSAAIPAGWGVQEKREIAL